MLTLSDLDRWAACIGLSSEARALVDAIRNSPPVRLVRSAVGNVSGRYPSRKMGHTVQFESHRLEFAGILEMEYDDSVLEYFDQPNTIKLKYAHKERTTKTGDPRKLGVLHTPDFFVIRSDTAGWEEWKNEDDLERLHEKMPNRYLRDAEGRWRCPPGEAYANSLGLYYRVRSSTEIDWTYQRNVLYLEDFLQSENLQVDPEAHDGILRLVADEPGITLTRLLRSPLTTADDLFAMIVMQQIYVDLRAVPLSESDRVHVFLDETTSKAYRYASVAGSSVTNPESPVVELAPGSLLTWDGKTWTIINVGNNKVYLRSLDDLLVTLSAEEVTRLVEHGEIRGLSSRVPTISKAQEVMSVASSKDLAEANRRFQLIAPILHRPDGTTSSYNRSIRRWIKRYRDADVSYGNGFIGLIPETRNRGNRERKIDERTKQEMKRFIEEEYETIKQQSKVAIYGALVNTCEEKGITPPSYKTFAKDVSSRPVHEQTRKRKGTRSAYPTEPFFWELTTTTPRHGERPWEIGHIDHTELDVETACPDTGVNLGRPWVTFLIDAFSRRLLAFWLTYDKPSYKSCMMVMRVCVKQHQRLPQIIVVDGGPEFRGVNFETLLARYLCTKKVRPGAKPRYGSVCERLFGTNNTQFVHNLDGNTQIMKNVRQVTKAVNPKTHALWTLTDLHCAMCEWAYEFYDSQDHPALGQSPRAAYELGISTSGVRTQRLIPYDREFLIYTYPSTPKGTAKVQIGMGVKINNIYYWSDTFRDQNVEGSRVEVRFDPFDFGHSFAYVGKQWVECHSEHYRVFAGRSETEIALATADLQMRHRSHNKKFSVRAAALARFLETSVDDRESLLAQKSRDRQTKSILSLVDGSNRAAAERAIRQHSPVPQENNTKQLPKPVPKPVGVNEVY